MKYISALFFIVIATIAVSFSLSNDTAVTLSVWPFPYTITLPVFLPILLSLCLGFIGGMLYNTIKKSFNKNKL